MIKARDQQWGISVASDFEAVSEFEFRDLDLV